MGNTDSCLGKHDQIKLGTLLKILFYDVLHNKTNYYGLRHATQSDGLHHQVDITSQFSMCIAYRRVNIEIPLF